MLARAFGFHDKEFYRLLLRLALPITAQYFISASLFFVDNIMVGLLGPSEAAAITIANSIYSVLGVSCFGLVSGCMMFYSQYWGSGDIKGLRKIMGINLTGVLILAGTFTVLMLAMPEQILSLYTKDPVVIAHAKEFITIACIGYIPNMVAYTFGAVLRSCNKVKLPMISSAIALAICTLLNWALIFGNLGLPKMGLRGSGIATLVSTVLDLCIILIATYRLKYPSAAKLSEMRFERHLLGRVMKKSLPVFAVELFWSIGVTVNIMFIGAIGTDALAAMSIYNVVDRLSFVLFIGLCNAIAVIIGNKIGAGEEDKAYLYGRRMLSLGPVVGVFIGVVVILLRPVVVSIYHYPAQVQQLAQDIMLISACTVPLIVYNFFMLVGVLRAGGDSKFCMIIDIGGMYLLSLPLVAVAVYVLKLPLQAAFAIYFAGEVAKIFFTTPRFRTKKWIVNLVKVQDAVPEEATG